MKGTKVLISILAVLAFANIGSSLIAQKPAQLDPLAIFDRDKRWYNGFTETWFYFFDIPENEIRGSIEHWEQIGADRSGADERAAGTYGNGGDTHGSYLRWSKEKGFVRLDVNKCQGGPMRITRGRVEVIPEGVVLVPEKRLGELGGHSGHGGHAGEQGRITLIAIDWVGGTFLVPKERVADFADYSAGLGEYNGQFTYMFDNPYFQKMAGEDEFKPDGRPPVYPAGYEKFNKLPVRGSVISIGKGRRVIDAKSENYDKFVTPVKVKLEHAATVKAPLNVHPVGEEVGFIEEFRIKSFRGKAATIEHIRLIPKKNCVISEHEDCKDPEHLKLRVGMVLSTNGMLL